MKQSLPQQSLLCTELFSFEGFPCRDIFEESLYPWDVLTKLSQYLSKFNQQRFKALSPQEHPGAHFVNPDTIYLAEGVVIEPGAYIAGPVAIGLNSIIRHAAYIRGNCLIGENCVIGHSSEAKGSIFLNGSKAAHFAYVGDSILGEGVNLGAGTKLANLRLNKKEISIQVGSSKFATGRKKLGALLGDRVQLGCNSVTNPGTVMGKGAIGLPLANLSGFYRSKTLSKPK